MSSRRAARRPQTATGSGPIPNELLSRLHRAWSDPTRIAAAFPEYVEPDDLALLEQVPGASGVVFDRVLARWAEAHGWGTGDGHADYHALSALGLHGGPIPQNESVEERKARELAFHRRVTAMP